MDSLSVDAAAELLRSKYASILNRFDPEKNIALLDRIGESASYHHLPPAVTDLWSAVTHEFGDEGFEAFQKATMLRLISNFSGRSSGKKYSDSVIDCFNKSFLRISQTINDPDFASYRTQNDILMKDLAICRQKMFPAGAQVVEPDSAFHRSLIFKGGINQATRFVSLLMSSGGSKRWYQIHTHLSELEDFNPDGWDRCYLRLADMLSLHPEIRGMWGGSWFYDPALETVSPRLTYLREVPQKNGARVFYSNVELDGGALSKSETRKSLYEKGEYLPKSYAVIWPRRDLLRWAARYRAAVDTNAAQQTR